MSEPGFDSGDIPGFDDQEFNQLQDLSSSTSAAAPAPPQMNSFDDDHLYTSTNNNNSSAFERNFDPQQMLQVMNGMQFNNPHFMNTMMQNMMRSQNNNNNNNTNMMMYNNQNGYMMMNPQQQQAYSMNMYRNNNMMTMNSFQNNSSNTNILPAPQLQQEVATNTVFLSRLDVSIFNEESLLAITNRFGATLKLDIKPHKGIAFVHFRSVEEAQHCVETLRREAGTTLNRNCTIGYGKLFEYDADGKAVKVNGEDVTAGSTDFRDKATQEFTGSALPRSARTQQQQDNGNEPAKTEYKVVALTPQELEALSHTELGARAASFRYRIGRYRIKNDPTSCIFFGSILINTEEVKAEFINFFRQFPGFEELSFSQKGAGMMFVHFDSVEHAAHCLGTIFYEYHSLILGRKPIGMDFGQPRPPREYFICDENNTAGRRRQRSQDNINNNNNNHNGNNNNNNNGNYDNIHENFGMPDYSALPAEYNPDAAAQSANERSKNLASAFKPKYLNRDRTKSASKIFSTILDLDGTGTGTGGATSNDNNNDDDNSNKLKAINSKISGLLTLSYFSCGLFPPHLTPDFVVSLSECVDRAYPASSTAAENHIEISQEPLIAEFDLIVQLNNCAGDYMPHAIAVVTKRLQEHFLDDDVKKLHVFYLVATALVKNASIQGGATVARGLDQFAWLTAVVAEAQKGQDALNHVKAVCEGIKASFVHLGSRVHEAFAMLDVVVAAKITAKMDVDDLLAQLEMI